MKKLRVLDLFSGIGGFSLGLERTGGFETVAFCEFDPAAQRVLRKHWPDVPVFDDVRALCRRTHDNLGPDDEWPEDELECSIHAGEDFGDCACIGTDQFIDEIGGVDLICGGFPCQDISLNGKLAGLEGERSGLWREYKRVISELDPNYVLIENVAALRNRGLAEVLQDLDTLGYFAEWHCIPASGVGAAHQRDRIWILAYAKSLGVEGDWTSRLEKSRSLVEPFLPYRDSDGQWEVEPDLRRSAYGVSTRLDGRLNSWGDRLKQCGNAVVPQIPEMFGRAILDFELNERL